MHRILLTLATVATLAAPAHAAVVRDCDETAIASNIVEPWSENSRTFYNGHVRVAYLDTGGEPVCCSGHLLVTLPYNENEPGGGQTCFIISDHDGMGFMSIEFAKLATSYNSDKGLLVTFPYSLYIDGIQSKKGVAKFRVNIAKHSVAIEK
jgi:hypothetical protein